MSRQKEGPAPTLTVLSPVPNSQDTEKTKTQFMPVKLTYLGKVEGQGRGHSVSTSLHYSGGHAHE